MLKLIKLELKHINLRVYSITTLILVGIILAFTYFVANAAQVTQETEFMDYSNIFQFTCIISILLFSVLSATMYINLIIKEYSGKRLSLLFSYPADRKKIFMAKVLIIFFLISISMMMCTIIPIVIFSITESFVPIVSDTITAKLLFSTFETIFVSVLFANIIGIFAMGIGFIKKSVTVTLISAFILFGVYGNIAIITSNPLISSLCVAGISLFITVIVLIILSNKVNQMEVD
ncbi:MAG: ABC transporter permease [Eubacteriales bacterium]|nr:ABC transporter permease [Eubacteriales bacterium]